MSTNEGTDRLLDLPPAGGGHTQYNQDNTDKPKGSGMKYFGIFLSLAIIVAAGVCIGLGQKQLFNNDSLPTDPLGRAEALHQSNIMVDGHNDMPWQWRKYNEGMVYGNGNSNKSVELLDTRALGWATDITRMKAGRVGAQFWAAYAPCSTQNKDAVRVFLEQVDTINKFVSLYSDYFTIAYTVKDIKASFQNNKIASLIGVEGGHAIDSSLAALRTLYGLGARYMTLTHWCNTPWSGTSEGLSTNAPLGQGLSPFGVQVVQEMNRLGMMVDLSHTSDQTVYDTFAATAPANAPVIFSHSAARHFCNNTRNLPDDIIRMVSSRNSIIMVNFDPDHLLCDKDGNPMGTPTVQNIVDHINYIVDLHEGIPKWVGYGSDYDGTDRTVVGAHDVSGFTAVTAALIATGRYTDAQITDIMGGNFLRVFQAVEDASKYILTKTGFKNPRETVLTNLPQDACRSDL